MKITRQIAKDYLQHSSKEEYDELLGNIRITDRQKFIIDEITGPKKKYCYQVAGELDVSAETVKNDLCDLLDKAYAILKKRKIDEEIIMELQEIAELLRDKYLKILVINKESRKFDVVIKPEDENLEGITTIDEYAEHYVSNNTLREPSKLRAFLKELNPNSWLVYHRGGNIVAFMELIDKGTELVLFVRDIGEIYSKEETAIKRQTRRRDEFTGLLSKVAFEYDISQKYTGLTGIVYADLNGLKKINDEQGHKAGDAAILNTVSVLQQVFPNYDIYRIGGDEFIAASYNASAVEFINTVEAARKSVYTNDIACGYAIDWADNVEKTIEEAEKRMYQDKRRRKES